jgi:uncharacterized membrane protein
MNLNGAHLHLLANHIPIVGELMGLIVLGYGIYKKNSEVLNAAYYVFILSAIGCLIAYLTGDSARDAIENMPGILKSYIDNHETAADISIWLIGITGGMSLIGLTFSKTQKEFPIKFSIAVLIVAIIAFAVVSYAGYLGGLIHHPEIR